VNQMALLHNFAVVLHTAAEVEGRQGRLEEPRQAARHKQPSHQERHIRRRKAVNKRIK